MNTVEVCVWGTRNQIAVVVVVVVLVVRRPVDDDPVSQRGPSSAAAAYAEKWKLATRRTGRNARQDEKKITVSEILENGSDSKRQLLGRAERSSRTSTKRLGAGAAVYFSAPLNAHPSRARTPRGRYRQCTRDSTTSLSTTSCTTLLPVITAITIITVITAITIITVITAITIITVITAITIITVITAITAITMESNKEHIEALLKDLTPSPSSPSPWQAEVITIEDDAAPADPITIDDDTESDCDL
ncbi:uncharacterized protein CPUR_05151 [Claviceps purpurea 20.1]|uniref:Uncharacterized protein n=1 Tax=Claviceps purpurea (strain 20.1) TaxID=1111077 RepID=M1W7U1_CLAP2|nr:uncharacterized protein CPUR_05151 [Claviceps purpurea 20.1]